MGRSRFARPDTRTLTLANGDTLTVKRRLASVEGRRLRAMQAVPTLAEPGLVMAYLVDWSLPEYPIAGKAHDDLGAALDALTDDDFDEIHAAINTHATAMAAERAEEKKLPAGESASVATSPSPGPAASAIETSET